ncbi:cupin domain-containing protein [Marinomonas sp. 15G1-11]|uniref:Cupin domain-containing protein n=1 Tax=Marinomonas phaeophyticola TaxID=3004091 RepID=A0ABT4JVS1_9GAMM|nr:cupin domain-containing protein [Marinomonas sp. 15G1-11]MCZ2722484.1 cupin domain-containing protein [Marinomonas sp. 15G1-11]
MKIAADFSKRIIVHSEALPWKASPMKGVDRRPLDRVGEEVARATTIVRYAPGSAFSPHVHTGGEEFFVLEGTFQDEHGDFPAGSYIRNPPQSSHTPSSEKGCMMLVKLWQFQPEDRTHIRLQTNKMGSIELANHTGVSITPLYKDHIEDVSLLHLQPHTTIDWDLPQGAELLVIEGSLTENNDLLKKHSWLRLPVNSKINAKAGNQGAKVWLKTGYLNDVNNQIARLQISPKCVNTFQDKTII